MRSAGLKNLRKRNLLMLYVIMILCQKKKREKKGSGSIIFQTVLRRRKWQWIISVHITGNNTLATLELARNVVQK